MKKISLCVTSYDRPDTLRQLVYSFLRQDYPDKELVISDDTPNGSVERMLQEFKSNQSIRYFHNDPGLGFARNLLASMKRASGEYIVILGDDDIFMKTSALTKYVQIFENNPSVGFVYANQIQFSDAMDIEYVLNFSLKDRFFKRGEDAMRNMFVRSIFIGGIGIRNSEDIERFYPKKNILHPQVELIGNIINNSDAYLIAQNFTGFRSHKDQIIFRALKNKLVRQEGNHVTIELLDIFKGLCKVYGLTVSSKFLERQLVEMHLVMMFKEKITIGEDLMEKNYKNFCARSPYANNSVKFRNAFILAKILPVSLIMFIKSVRVGFARIIRMGEYHRYKEQLITMTSRSE